MPASFEVGDEIPLTWAIDVAGTPTNATVVLTVTLPDGTSLTPTVSNPTTGNYAAKFTAATAGRYAYRWVATGAVVAAESGTFTVGTDYTTLALLKTSLGLTSDTNDDAALARAISTASRAIDAYCGTQFYPSTEARTFAPSSSGDVWVDRFTSTVGLVVQTGTDGAFSTTVGSNDVLPWPHNAPKTGGAYCRLLIATGALPVYSLRPTVQVTAQWGWHYVPEQVADATLIKAAHLFRRKDSPDGVAGSGEFGVVRISRYEDPDVVSLLAPYVQVGIA